MDRLTRYDYVIEEHICLYVYSVKLNKFRIFNDVKLIKNIMIPSEPLYYIHYYSKSDNTEYYTVSPNAGEVLHSNGEVFKVWFMKEDDAVGIKSLLDAIDVYIAEQIEEAHNTITTMKKQQDLAHEELLSMTPKNFGEISIPNARFIFHPNFEWDEQNFNVILEGDALKQALEYGLNVKTTTPYEGAESVHYIKVDIDHKYHAPDVRLKQSEPRVTHYLSRATMSMLDDCEFENIDMVISFSSKEVYLKTLYAKAI